MDGKTLATHLRELCSDLDAGQVDLARWRKMLAPLAAPLVLTGALALGGCPAPELPEAMDIYGAPPVDVEVCNDALDNNGDGRMDCADPTCAGHPACTMEPAVTLYGAPRAAEICGDGADNDGDGKADCADEECAGQAICVPVPAYAAPPMVELCGDGIDNDNDGRADCADPRCSGLPACQTSVRYGVPFPRD